MANVNLLRAPGQDAVVLRIVSGVLLLLQLVCLLLVGRLLAAEPGRDGD